MDKQPSGTWIWLVIALVAMGYIFSVVQIKLTMPAVSAQIAANEKAVTAVEAGYTKLIGDVNTALGEIDKRLTALEKKP